MPNQVSGARGSMSYIEESAWGDGVPSNPSPYWTGFAFVRESFKKDINTFQSNTIRGDRQTGAILRGNRRADGDVVFELGPQSHNLLIRHLIGGWWTTASAGGGLTYHRNVPQSTGALPGGGLVFLKVFGDLGSPDTYLKYTGGRIDSCTFDVPQEGIVSCTARVLCKLEADPTTNSPADTLPSEDPYESNLTAVTLIASNTSWTTTTAIETAFDAGTPIAIAAGARFAINNQLDGGSYVLNSYDRYSIPLGRRRCEGSLNLLFDSTTHYLDYVNGTVMAARFKFQNSLTSPTRFTEFYFPAIKYAGPSPTPAIESEGGVRYDLPFQAFAHSGFGFDCFVRVKNAESIVHLNS